MNRVEKNVLQETHETHKGNQESLRAKVAVIVWDTQSDFNVKERFHVNNKMLVSINEMCEIKGFNKKKKKIMSVYSNK